MAVFFIAFLLKIVDGFNPPDALLGTGTRA
jgi:hypothetical protein